MIHNKHYFFDNFFSYLVLFNYILLPILFHRVLHRDYRQTLYGLGRYKVNKLMMSYRE